MSGMWYIHLYVYLKVKFLRALQYKLFWELKWIYFPPHLHHQKDFGVNRE